MINDTEARLNDLQADLHKCRRAITYRGGEISATAGFKEVVKKIQTLPPSSSVGTVIDDTSSLFKMVPVGSTKYCYLKSLGGMTYKSNNLLPFPYYGGKGVGHTETLNGITFTVNKDGSITINGTGGGVSFLLANYLNLPKADYCLSAILVSGEWTGGTSNAPYISGFPGGYATGDRRVVTNNTAITWLSINVPSGITVNNITLKIMLNTGSTALPYEDYYEGLKDTKPTAIKVRGANYLKPYYGPGYKKTSGGITFTVNADRSITVNGTAVGTPALVISNNLDLPVADYYLAGNCVDGEWVSGVNVYTADSNYQYYHTSGTAPVVKIPANSKFTWVSIRVLNGTTVNNLTLKPMLSMAQALPYTDYHEPVTYPIPEELQGTGKGVSGASDTMDFENDKSIVNCETVVFDGTEPWEYRDAYRCVIMSTPLSKSGKGHTYIIANTPIHIEYSNAYMDRFQMGKTAYPLDDYGITSAEDWKNYLSERYASGNPLTVTYAIAEPTSTDIDTSAFDHLIEVESGGSIEVVTDTGKEVPSTIIYQTIT